MAKRNRKAYPPVCEALPIPVIDNHTHLPVGNAPGAFGDERDYSHRPSEEIPPSIDEHLARMETCGIRGAITCGCELPEIPGHIELARAYSQKLWAAIAIHPNEAPLHQCITEKSPDGMEHGLDEHHRQYTLDDALAVVADHARDSSVVAIGETGLDYYRTGDAGKEAQKESFRAHIALAKELDLPLQIHDRDAHADVVDVLKAEGAPQRTVFHCFSGDVQLAHVCAEQGWFASFSGTLTYKGNDDLRAAFLVLPDELILLETDAPYLTPQEFRGQPNAPYVAAYTARAMSDIRHVSLDTWCETLSANTHVVYGL
ncbi:MAG: TatD family hydrolase [Actinomycetaceae bacterium]|nr:TatD family hydrolase [Actinomycetaceae bacterium]